MSNLQITGRLLCDARAQCSVTHHWSLVLDLCPPAGPKGKARVYRALRSYGQGEAAAIACKTAARHLRGGALVRVHAGAEDGGRISMLHEVSSIEPLASQRPRYPQD